MPTCIVNKMWRKMLCLFVAAVNRGYGSQDFTTFYVGEHVNQCSALSGIHEDDSGLTNSTCKDYLRGGSHSMRCDPILFMNQMIEIFLFSNETNSSSIPDEDLAKSYIMYPDGGSLRAERFNARAAVHLPQREALHRGAARLRLTRDRLQTAVNALFILLQGTIEDVYNLPPEYVLKSARTISMLIISKEKLAATWTVVKQGLEPAAVPFRTLGLYRPLFKYLNAREMAQLNLSDTRILSYIGTHPELNRHQVGIVAKAYLKLNPRWAEASSMNLMNNLICGVPICVLRRVPDNTFLMLSDQLFFHIRACDPIQRQYMLMKMTRSQALGKSHSWTAHDVLSLGLLMAQVKGQDLAVMSLEAMAGFTSPVVSEMNPVNLRHFSHQQLKSMGPKPLSIARLKIRNYLAETNAARAAVAAGLVAVAGLFTGLTVYVIH